MKESLIVVITWLVMFFYHASIVLGKLEAPKSYLQIKSKSPLYGLEDNDHNRIFSEHTHLIASNNKMISTTANSDHNQIIRHSTDHYQLKKVLHSLFPIFPNEIKPFIALSTMMFCIVFIFTITRDTKDTLIVTNCGAEAISFLKVYGVIPMATIFMLIYSYLNNKLLSKDILFYIILSFFLSFYMIFGFVLYPKRAVLHPVINNLLEQSSYNLNNNRKDSSWKYALSLIQYWTFSLYYIISELWGSVGLTILFWSFVNEVIRLDQVSIIILPLYFTNFTG
jgi:ATP/ADP translocase